MTHSRGARRAASLGPPLWGVRLDSGNLGELAVAVRRILDEAGLRDSKIMATGDLNEYKIQELMAARAPIDVFGVGTELATSADAPSLGVVYKLVELEDAGGRPLSRRSSVTINRRCREPSRSFALQTMTCWHAPASASRAEKAAPPARHYSAL